MNQLLVAMDYVVSSANRDVFVVAATAHPERIDQAVLTRFPRKIEIPLSAPNSREVTTQELQNIWSKIILKPDIKASILRIVQLFNRSDGATPRGLLLCGPPGTGKTEIARRMAESINCQWLWLAITDLKAAYVGQTSQRVKEVWNKIRSLQRCVVFIDECDSIFPRRGGPTSDAYFSELVQEFLAQWDTLGRVSQVLVVGETSRPEAMDAAVLSRFGTQVATVLPDSSERLQMLRLELQKLQREGEIPGFIETATSGYTGRDLANLARDVHRVADERHGSATAEIWKEGIRGCHPSHWADENTSWDCLILNDNPLRQLKIMGETLRHLDTLGKQGFSLPEGAILYGPPGTGKTQAARILAAESRVGVVAIGPIHLKGVSAGQSARNVRELFEPARKYPPCILFIDEFDAVAPARGGSYADQATDEIVDELLVQLDEIRQTNGRVFVLTATRYVERVEPEVLSRLRFKIEIPSLEQEQRQKLFKMLLGKQRINFDFELDTMAAELAVKAAGLNGRDIYNVVYRASQAALQHAFDENKLDRVCLTRQDLLTEVSRVEYT